MEVQESNGDEYICNNEPIDCVSEIYSTEFDKNALMKRSKDVEYTDPELPKYSWVG